MIDIFETRKQLNAKSDLDWFDAICEILKKDNQPTVSLLENLIGPEKPNPNKEIRGSKFLNPIDPRFTFACISPNIDSSNKDANLNYFAVQGRDFKLLIKDIKARFNNVLINSNLYDGGTQLFFYPVPVSYEFSAISFNVNAEKKDIQNIDDLIVHSITFRFGNRLTRGKDGLGMTNE